MKKIIVFAIPALIAAIFGFGIVRAQVNPDVKVYLVENGANVGEIYVPERAPDATEYYEHWVLSPNYQYPGPKFMGKMQVTPSPTERPYASEADFFRNVPFPAGSKYVRVFAQEYSALPSAR